MSTIHQFSIGWICAVDTEIIAAEIVLDEVLSPPDGIPPSDVNSYKFGRISGHHVIVACLPQGQYGVSNATAAVKDMLRSFPMKTVVMVGIAGGAPNLANDIDIRRGDVVVSSPGSHNGGVVQYMYGKKHQNEVNPSRYEMTGHLNQPPHSMLIAVNQLQATHRMKGHRIQETMKRALLKDPSLKPKLREELQRPAIHTDRLYRTNVIHTEGHRTCDDCGNDQSTLVPRKARATDDDDPTIHYGSIASSDTLMKDAVMRDRLSQDWGVLCFEMEAAGLMNHVPCTVIRGICDYSDSHKNKIWQGYAAMTAAAYTKELLSIVRPDQIRAEERLDVKIEANLSKFKKDLTEIKETITQDKVEKWLSPPDPSINLNKAQAQHHAGTGVWLLRSDDYQAWKKGTHDNVKRMLRSCRQGHRQPDDTSLHKLFQDILRDSGEIWIVLDALDECHSRNEDSKHKLLPWIRELRLLNLNIHIMVTSQPAPDINSSIVNWSKSDEIVYLQRSLVDHDIRAYIKAKIKEIDKWEDRPDVQAEIETVLSQKANGMFRWVSCQFDVLKDCLDWPSVRKELRNLPKSLEESYERIIGRIKEQHHGYATRLLQFFAYSERPLTLQEAVDIIAIDASQKTPFDPANRIPVPQEIVRFCSSLVTIVQRTDIMNNATVYRTVTPARRDAGILIDHWELSKLADLELHIAHSSVQDYLRSSRRKEFLTQGLEKTTASSAILETYISYLLQIDRFYRNGSFSGKDDIRQKFPLAEYSVQHWPHHTFVLKQSAKRLSSMLVEYLLSAQFPWIQSLNHGDIRSNGCELHNIEDTGHVHGLRYASMINSPEVVNALLEKGTSVNAHCPCGNALLTASELGHRDVV